jgi:hypothetical protein
LKLFLRFMRECVDPYHCKPIGVALAAYGDAAQPHLIKQLRSSSWDESGGGFAAAHALGTIGTDEAIDALVAALGQERNNDIRDLYETVAEALVQSSNPRARKFVEERIAKPDYRFIAAAVSLLTQRVDNKVIIRALEEEGGMTMASALLNDPDPVLRKAARDWAVENGYRIETFRSSGTITP